MTNRGLGVGVLERGVGLAVGVAGIELKGWFGVGGLA